MPAQLRLSVFAILLVAALVLPGPAAAAPHEAPATGSLCLLAFDDANANGARETGEALLAGVVFTVRDGAHVVQTYTTDGTSEPHCVDLLAGDYRIAEIDAPAHHATSNQSWDVAISANNAFLVEYGSSTGGRPAGFDLASTLYALSGILFFVAAAAVGAYVVMNGRRR